MGHGRIPIGRTIGATFDFALGRYWAILGVIWLPLLLLLAAQYFVLVPYFIRLFDFMQYAIQHAKEHPTAPSGLQAMTPMIWSLNGLTLVLSVWMQVGLTKTALGLRTGPLFVYVPVGLDELRVIGGVLVFIAILYGVCLGVGIVGAIVAMVLFALASGGAFAFSVADGVKPWLACGIVACVAAILCAIVYVQIRFTYLLVPVTVAEKRFGLWRSWEMSKGNFWRTFMVGVGTLSPMVAFEFILIFAFYFALALSLITKAAMFHPHSAGHPNPAAAAAFMKMLFQDVAIYGGIVAAIVIPLLPIFYGLRCASSAFAYKALTEKAS